MYEIWVNLELRYAFEMRTLTVEPSIIRYLVKVRIGNAYLNFLPGKISCLVNWIPRHRNRI